MKALTKQIIASINSEIGEGAMVLRGAQTVQREGLSTGSPYLNYKLSGNPLVGYVWGRIVEIYGPEQSGKTTLALHAAVEAKRLDLPVVFVDAEHAIDPTYAESIGVDLDNMILVQPDTGEQGIETVRAAVMNDTKLVIVDSVAALVPKAELEGDTGDAHMAKQARLMGQAMRQLTGVISKNKAIVIFINQIRMNVGQMFGNPETTAGGKALKFYASYRIECRSPRGGAEKQKTVGGEVELGIHTKLKIVKNKLFPPFKTAKVYIEYGKGINKYRDVAMLFSELGGGSSKFDFGGKKVGMKQLARLLEESKATRKKAGELLREMAKDSD